MAVSAITGQGDPDVLALLPAAVPAHRVALAGLHAWAPLLSWLASTATESPYISTSTSWAATKWCSGSAPTRAG